MLYGTAPHRHHIWVFIQPVLSGFENGFMLPAFDAALPARSALLFQRTAGAGRSRCPVVPHDFAIFFVGETVGQALARGAKIDILVRFVDKILLVIPPLGLGV